MPSQVGKNALRILICGGSTSERNRIDKLLSDDEYYGKHAHASTVPETLTLMRAGCFGLTLCFSDVPEISRLIQTASTDEQLIGIPVIVIPPNTEQLLAEMQRATPR